MKSPGQVASNWEVRRYVFAALPEAIDLCRKKTTEKAKRSLFCVNHAKHTENFARRCKYIVLPSRNLQLGFDFFTIWGKL